MEFNKLLRLLIPHVVIGALKAPRIAKGKLTDNLNKIEFVTREITKIGEQLVVKLQVLNEDSFYQFLAGDANRFLMASRISLMRSAQLQAGNGAWQAVEHYYAAYYAVHYLIRMTGISLTTLDDKAIKIIKACCFGDVATTELGGGLYLLRYDDNSKEITLSKVKKGGGSHKMAWSLWMELVEKLSSETNSDPLEYAKISLDLSDHKKFINKSADSYGPSDVRSEINYQFRGGLWIFEDESSESVRRVQSLISTPAITALNSKYNSESLIQHNKIIIGLGAQLFKHASTSYPRGICRSLSNKYKAFL